MMTRKKFYNGISVVLFAVGLTSARDGWPRWGVIGLAVLWWVPTLFMKDEQR